LLGLFTIELTKEGLGKVLYGRDLLLKGSLYCSSVYTQMASSKGKCVRNKVKFEKYFVGFALPNKTTGHHYYI
jgi:hypothetical protein